MKRILRVLMLVSLIAIPSLVRALSVTFTTTSYTTGCNAVFCSFTPTVTACTGTPVYTWYYIKNPAATASDTVISTSPNHSFTDIGNYNVLVKVVCGTETAYSPVAVNYVQVTAPPTINFRAANVPADTLPRCAGVINFTNTSTGDTICSNHSWRWIVNGPAVIADQFTTNASFNFTTPGDYTVTLIFSSGCSCFGSISRVNYIHIAPNPTACFTRIDTNSSCQAPVTMVFSSGCSTGAANYTWSFTGGSPASAVTSATTTTVTFNTPGDFPVNLTATSAVGCSSTATPMTVHVGNFTANFLASPLYVCENATVTLTDATTVDVIAPVTQTFFIRDGLGSTVSSGTGPSWAAVMNFGPGAFTIEDYLVNGNGCIATATHPLNVRPKPTTSVTFPSNPYRCAPPLTTTFHAIPDVATNTYTWSFAPSPTATFTGTGTAGANPTYTYAFPVTSLTTYNPTLKVTDVYGCVDSAVYPGLVRVGPPSFTIQKYTDSGCTPILVRYHVDMTPTDPVTGATYPFTITSFNWGDGSPAAGSGSYTDTSHVYTTVGTFSPSITWQLPGSLGSCTGTATIASPVVIGSNKPNINVTSSYIDPSTSLVVFDDSVCPHTNVFLDDNDTCSSCTWNWTIRTGPGIVYTVSGDTTTVNYPFPSSLGGPIIAGGDTAWSYQLISCRAGCCDTYNHHIYVFPPTIQETSLSGSYFGHCNRPDSIDFRCNGQVPGTVAAYVWDFGDGSPLVTTTGNTVGHTYPSAFPSGATYTVTVTAVATAVNRGCTNTDQLVIYVGPQDSTWRIRDSTICVNGTVTYVGPRQPDGSPYSTYFWNWGDGSPLQTIAADSVATHIYTAAGTYTNTVIFVNNSNCRDTGIILRTRVYGPTGGLSAVPNPVCAGDNVLLTDLSTFPGTTIYKRMWSFDYAGTAGGPVGDASLVSYPVSPATLIRTFPEGTWIIALSDTDNSPKRCGNITFDTIISSRPHAFFTSPDTVGVCAGLPISFHDTNTNCTYSWNFGDGTITPPSAADSNIVHTYTANGNYTVSVTIVSNGVGSPVGCSSTFTRPNYIRLSNNSGISIANYGDTSVGCPPLQLAVGPTSTSTSYLYNYLWTVTGAGGGTFNSTFVFASLTSVGVQTVTMIATSPRGCADTVRRTYVVGGPSGYITVTPTSGCGPLNVNLHYTDTGALAAGSNYIWNTCPFGSFTTTTPDTTMLYSTPGVYCPPSVVIQNGGCAVTINNVTDSIRVFSTPIVSVVHAPRICYGGIDTLYASGADTYTWFGPSGSLCPGSCSFITVAPLVNTVYTVIGTNASGCSDTELVTVMVDSPILITISGRPDICIGQQDTLYATGGSGVFAWHYPPGISCPVCNPVIITTTTTRTYWAVTTNALGCTDSASFTVTVHPLPILKVTPDPAYVCDGSSTQLHVTGASTYLWTPRIGLDCDTCANPTTSIVTNLIYSVTGTTVWGCRDSITVPVEVYHHNVTGARSDTTICAGDKAQLSAQGGLSYVWRPGNTLSDSTIYNPIAKPAVTTIYTVYITENPCFSDIQDVKVTVIPIPILRVPPTITIIAGNSVQLYADPLNAVTLTSYAWTPADSTLTCNDCPQPIATPIVTTTYSVAASTIEGCTGYNTVTIKLLCETNQVFIPNTFTPNGDGNNDRFYVSGKGLGLIKRMAVYNRWGELVYEAYNVRPNDPGVGWDGTYRGEVVAPDVFIYVLDVMCSTGEPFMFRGDISLVR